LGRGGAPGGIGGEKKRGFAVEEVGGNTRGSDNGAGIKKEIKKKKGKKRK